MTEKVYHSDAYCREIAARITGRELRDGFCRLRLERTIFFPEGGGQPADQGTIDDFPVLSLEADGGEIIHVLERDPGRDEVILRLDFERRYDHMQQHTAQHLLSQVLVRRFAAATLSFAIGAEHSSIEAGRPAFSEEEIRVLEAECARLAFAALPVRVFESDDPSALRLRKPPKVEGRIRVVEIEGFDQTACGGTHVKNTAELGLLKIVRTERVRGNVRLYYVAGWRALRDFQLKHDFMQRLQRLVTQPLAEIPAQMEAMVRERDRLRRELKKAQRSELEAAITPAAASEDPLVVHECSGLDASDLRFLASVLLKMGKHALVFQRTPEPYVVIGRGRGGFDLRRISAQAFSLLGGKGGGGPALLEGRGGDFSRIGDLEALLRSSLDAGT